MMSTGSSIALCLHNLLLHQFYDDVSFPSYLKKKNKTKQNKTN